MGLIYKAISPSGKSYIGQTTKTFQKRTRNHKSDMKRNKTIFSRALKKYGWENFEWETLEEGNFSQDELNKKEIFYINKYDSYSNGYNATLGGGGVSGYNRVHSEETKKKIRMNHVGMKNKKHSEETKKKMSDSHYSKNPKYKYLLERRSKNSKGEKNPMFGRKQELSSLFRVDIDFKRLCDASILNNYKRNKTAKYLKCNRSTIRNRMLEAGFGTWNDFCKLLKERK